jgi:hypothetical protein
MLMENYDINRSGYHDTHDTMKLIDLDYGSAGRWPMSPGGTVRCRL